MRKWSKALKSSIIYMPRNKCNKWPSKFFTKVFTDGGIQLFHPIRSAFFFGLKSAHVYTFKSVYIPCHSNLYYKILKFLESSSCYIIKLWKGEVGIASCPFLKITNKDFTQVMGNTLTQRRMKLIWQTPQKHRETHAHTFAVRF